MSGVLNGEGLDDDLNPDKLDEPVNWDLDEILDYSPETVYYDVDNPNANPNDLNRIHREHLSTEELWNYLDHVLNN